MTLVVLVLLLAAFVCFVFAALVLPNAPPRPNLVATGLALWVLTALIAAVDRLHGTP